MSLVHYVRPFLELGNCKEYSMARKTTGTTTTSRSKKAATTVPPVIEQVAAPIQKEVPKIVAQKNVAQKIIAQETRAEVRQDTAKEGRKNGKANVVAAGVPTASAPAAIEEQIRRRAYELYLERRATAGMANGNGYSYGDENQDWLIAEREIRSRQENQGHHSA
jgi:preprotein translocase subunit SecD